MIERELTNGAASWLGTHYLGTEQVLVVMMKLIAAHFLAWGLVQRGDWLPGQTQRPAFQRHAVAGTALYAGVSLLLLMLGGRMGFADTLCIVALTSVGRLAVDALLTQRLPRSWSVLLATQMVQLLVIYLATTLTYAGYLPTITILNSPRTYAVAAAYAASLWLGGTLVRLVTGLLARAEEERIGIDGAGSIIGILERLLVTSFVLFWPQLGAAAIGLIFSAKSIARFPEMGKENGTRFAEYYLVGTLTSFTVAIGAGMLARTYFAG